MTIIDMRGSQAQVVTDLSKLSDTAPAGGPGGGVRPLYPRTPIPEP